MRRNHSSDHKRCDKSDHRHCDKRDYCPIHGYNNYSIVNPYMSICPPNNHTPIPPSNTSLPSGYPLFSLTTGTGPDSSNVTSGPFIISTDSRLHLWSPNGEITASTGSVSVKFNFVGTTGPTGPAGSSPLAESKFYMNFSQPSDAGPYRTANVTPSIAPQTVISSLVSSSTSPVLLSDF